MRPQASSLPGRAKEGWKRAATRRSNERRSDLINEEYNADNLKTILRLHASDTPAAALLRERESEEAFVRTAALSFKPWLQLVLQ